MRVHCNYFVEDCGFEFGPSSKVRLVRARTEKPKPKQMRFFPEMFCTRHRRLILPGLVAQAARKVYSFSTAAREREREKWSRLWFAVRSWRVWGLGLATYNNTIQ